MSLSTVKALDASSISREGSTGEVSTFATFAFVVLSWAFAWIVMKVAVREVTPLWAVAIRTSIAAAVLVPAVVLSGKWIVPVRRDMPIVLVISLFHMVAFAALMTAGLKYVPVGRSIVLAYTTPLWVAPASVVFLKESLSFRQIVGIAIGIAGLLILFEPGSLNWRDPHAVMGNGLILASALCWSVSIVYTRVHRWAATPLQLMPWQTSLAAVILVALALCFDGLPRFGMSTGTIAALTYNGAVAVALGFWAMTVVTRRLPASTVSLGVLTTPVVAILLAAVLLGEPLTPTLLTAAATIALGVVIGIPKRR